MLKLKKNISPRLVGRPGLNELDAKIEELKSAAELVSPEGGLYVMVIDKGDTYSPISKAVRALLDLERVYSYQSLQRAPEMANEFAEINQAISTIEKVFGSRVRKQIRSREERNKNREVAK